MTNQEAMKYQIDCLNDQLSFEKSCKESARAQAIGFKEERDNALERIIKLLGKLEMQQEAFRNLNMEFAAALERIEHLENDVLCLEDQSSADEKMLNSCYIDNTKLAASLANTEKELEDALERERLLTDFAYI